MIYYAKKTYVEFDHVASAQRAYETLNGKRIDGSVWRIFPCKK